MIQVRTDDRFRATAACLLLTPYVEHQKEFRPHPVRDMTMRAVERRRDHACAGLFRDLVARGYFGSHFYCMAANMTPGLPFGWIAPFRDVVAWLPPGEEPTEFGLEERLPSLLTSFAIDAELPETWESTRQEWEQVKQQVHGALATGTVEAWVHSFWGPAPKQLVVVPNPTDPATFGFAPSNEHEAFCLIGPQTVPPTAPEASAGCLFDYARGDLVTSLVVHEFGHSYLTAQKRGMHRLAEQAHAASLALPLRGWFHDMYPTEEIQLEEMILTAVHGVWKAEKVSRDEGERHINESIERFGIELVRPIYEGLLEQRRARTRPGAEGCMLASRAAIERFCAGSGQA